MSEATIDLSQPVFRTLRDSDLPFIYSSWRKSYWDGHIKHFPNLYYSDFCRFQTALISKLFSRPSIEVIAAALPNDDNVLAGWIMLEKSPEAMVMHYCYVAVAFRRLGIARKLLSFANNVPFAYTHHTKKAKWLTQGHMCVFNPWILSC